MSDEFDAASIKEDFVNDASKEEKLEKENLLLMVGGQISGRKENYSKSQSYYLHNSIDDWIRESGRADGNLQIIVNYLLKRGIESIEERGKMIVVNASKFNGINN